MSSYENVTIERHGPIALVRFDRSGPLNAFNHQSLMDLPAVAPRFQYLRLIHT